MNERINLKDAQALYEKKQNSAWQDIQHFCRVLKIDENPENWGKNDFLKFTHYVTKRQWMRGLLSQEEFGMILTEVNTAYYKQLV